MLSQVDYVLLIFIPVVILTLMFFRTQIFQINPNTSGPCWLEHVTHFNFLFLFWNQIQTKSQTMTVKYECRTFPPISSEKLLFDLIDMPFQCKLFSNFNCNREFFSQKTVSWPNTNIFINWFVVHSLNKYTKRGDRTLCTGTGYAVSRVCVLP